MTKKAMVIAPFSAWMDWDKKEMFPEKRQLLETVIGTLECYGYDVLSAHRRENWGKDWWPADESTHLDYKWIEGSDLVVALPGDPASGGTHIELGWRTAHGKNLAVLLENDGNYSPLVHGLGDTFENVDYIKYGNQGECLESLKTYLGKIEQKEQKNRAFWRVARPLAVAASLAIAFGIGHLTEGYRINRQLQESQTAELRDYAVGLSELSQDGEYVGEHGTVQRGLNSVIMYPSGSDISNLRLYGISIDVAQRSVLRKIAKLE